MLMIVILPQTGVVKVEYSCTNCKNFIIVFDSDEIRSFFNFILLAFYSCPQRIVYISPALRSVVKLIKKYIFLLHLRPSESDFLAIQRGKFVFLTNSSVESYIH